MQLLTCKYVLYIQLNTLFKHRKCHQAVVVHVFAWCLNLNEAFDSQKKKFH